MKSLAAIRTHKWGAAEQRLFQTLHPVFGDDLAVAFHNRPADLAPPVKVADFNDAWVDGKSLFRPADYGWRCGDYALYALRERFPGYDHYWLIEPDVHFTSVPHSFFDAFQGVTTDLLGSRVETYREQGRFSASLGDLPPVRATFALTRMSGRAIDHLLLQRQALSKQGIGPRFWPNDELFCYSLLSADPGFAVGSFEDTAPGWFEGTTIAPSPDHLLDAVQEWVPPGRVLHPVHDQAGFSHAIIRRLSDGAEFLSRHRQSLAHMNEDEFDKIAFRVGQEIRAKLQANRDRYLTRSRQRGGESTA